MKLFTDILPETVATHPLPPPRLEDLLAPIFETATSSSSLIASRNEVRLGTKGYEIPKFLFLGQRGGGKPIRVGIFAGFDAQSIETVVALTRLLLQHELSPALARDYALFAYPVVNIRGFDESSETLSDFEFRYRNEPAAPDVQFFKAELEGWNFDGIVSLRIDPAAQGFHATSRSEVLAQEVVDPAVRAIKSKLPLEESPVSIRSADRRARIADQANGKLTAPIGVRPYPFEFEIFAPGTITVEERITGLFLILQEILRNYRRLISHAQNI